MELIEEELNDHAELHKTHKQFQEEMREFQAEMRHRMGIAESSTVNNKVLNDDIYNRPLDKTVMFIDAQEDVTKESMLVSVTEWLEDAGVADNSWTLKGKDLDKKFILRFKGAVNIAAGLAQRATQALKVDGEWRNMEAQNAVDAKIRVYVNTDKNAHQKRREITTRRLLNILLAEPGWESTKLFANRKDGQIFHNFMPLVKIEVEDSEKDAVLRWNPKGMAKVPNFTKLDIATKLNQKKADLIQWEL